MTRPFSHWSEEIAAASDEGARRALLGKIGMWRATRIMDVPAQREASWALSELHRQLGNADQARNEASQLVSLCRAAPEASRDEMHFAERVFGQLSGRPAAPRRNEERRPRAEERPARGEERRADRRAEPRAAEPTREESRGSWEEAVNAAQAGDFAAARRAAGGARGPRADLFRAWVDLSAALAGDPAALAAEVSHVRDVLGALFVRPAPQRPSDPLSDLLGRAAPERRDPLVDALEAWLAEHPEREDDLAAAALRHHVGVHGLRETAPWLTGFVGRALSGESPATRAALDELSAAGAWAVTAYDEAPFRLLVEVARLLRVDGHAVASLRRGVLARAEPGEHRIWTLRTRDAEGRERFLASADAHAGYDDTVAARLAQRLRELADNGVLAAPGAGNAALRAASLVLGVGAMDSADAGEIAAAVRARPGSRREAERPVRERPAREPATSRAEAPADAPARPARGPSPMTVLAQLFEGESIAPPEAYAPALEELRRAFRSFSAIRRAALSLPDADPRLAAFLRAVHASAPAGVRLAEGTTLAVRVAASAPGGEVEALLTGGDELAARYGGPDVAGLLQVARQVLAAGGQVDRVLSGLSRREREAQPGLAALEGNLGGLWRLLVSTEGRRGEVWWLSELTPEGQAAVPLLQLEERPRVVLSSDDGELLSADALREAMSSWPVWSGSEGAEEEGA